MMSLHFTACGFYAIKTNEAYAEWSQSLFRLPCHSSSLLYLFLVTLSQRLIWLSKSNLCPWNKVQELGRRFVLMQNQLIYVEWILKEYICNKWLLGWDYEEALQSGAKKYNLFQGRSEDGESACISRNSWVRGYAFMQIIERKLAGYFFLFLF